MQNEKDLKNRFSSSSPNDSAILEKLTYESKYCLPLEVMTNVFFPSYSILLINPAPVKFAKNLDNLECERFAFVSSDVVLIPSCPDNWVTVNRSATICILVL